MTGADLDRWLLATPDDALRALSPGAANVALRRKDFLEHGGLYCRAITPPEYGQQVTPR